ncbi:MULTISPECIES: hypothetical protein [Halomonadaceae]|uniref:hypothetical protein n=1 Tax=Halomonadaceae TaxID=28256 RepID=UPI00159901CF|nr:MULTISPECIES: hypothetical protein [Halomonas]QJQ96765.1 hypothetical protein HIO72_16750 [Halomonas sp. PA5]
MIRILLLAAAAYWLRKPENREKLERQAKQAWNRVQGREDFQDDFHDDRRW